MLSSYDPAAACVDVFLYQRSLLLQCMFAVSLGGIATAVVAAAVPCMKPVSAYAHKLACTTAAAAAGATLKQSE
jgi:hypothetical protein